MCPTLKPNLQVLCYIDTLSPSQRRRLPVVVPYSWTLNKVRRIAERGGRVIRFVPVLQDAA